MQEITMRTPPISFTLDLEDHHGVYAQDGRWVKNSHAILDWCAAQNNKGTFFTVGRAAAAAPALLQRIVRDGHELALHSYDHIHLTREDPKTYRSKLGAAKAQFEDITGKRIVGFRAPQFSLTPQSRWVLDDLCALGFTYSSSIIAGRGLFHGFAGKPQTPFMWEEGVYEFPVPVLRVGRAALPFLGGVYLRYLPLPLVNLFAQSLPKETALWTYLHPYDCDADEGFVRLTDGTPFWANFILMHNRKNFLDKLAALLKGRAGVPLAEICVNIGKLT